MDTRSRRYGYQDGGGPARTIGRRGTRPQPGNFNIPSFDADAFKGSFSFDTFFNDLVCFAWPIADDLSESSSQTDGSQPAGGNSTVTGFPVADNLLPVFNDVRRELIDLGLQIDAKLLKLKKEVAAQDAEHKEALSKLEQGVEGLNDSFERLNNRISGVGQTAARIGNHLQSADAQKETASQAIELIKYLIDFNSSRRDLLQFSPPAALFSDDKRMADAASITQKLRSLAEEEVSDDNIVQIQAAPGLEVAVNSLREYSNDLENKLLAKFDLASQKRDLATMGECAKILEQFNRGSQAIQRYVATRPMFLDIEVMQADIRLALGENTISSLSNVSNTARGLASLYSEIMETMRLEAETVAAVFPSPKAVMALLSKRVLYQRVQNVLDAMLPKPDLESPLAVEQGGLANYLRTLLIAFEKTMDLAKDMKEVGCGDTDPEALVERELFLLHLDMYPEVEHKSLMQLFHAKYLEMSQNGGGVADSAAGPAGGVVRGLNRSGALASDKDAIVSHGVVNECIKWNVEAIARCKKFIPEHGPLQESLQRIFGVLLDQVSVCTMLGLEKALKAVAEASSLKDKFNLATTVSRRVAAAAQAAAEQAAVAGEQGVKTFLVAVKRSTLNVAAVHQHFVDVLIPILLSIDKPQVTFMDDFTSKLSEAEKTVLKGLQICLDTVFGEVDRLLQVEQKATDYKPTDDGMVVDHRATRACSQVIAYLGRIFDSVQVTLEGPNRNSFLIGLGYRLHRVLLAHFQRFNFNLSGGLRLKRDVSEYADFVRSFKSPAADEKFENLSLLVNLLIVAPEGLPTLVDGSKMNIEEAMAFLQLREDYKSAKIANLFSI